MRHAVTQREAYCKLLDDLTDNHDYNLSTELFPSKQDRERVTTILQQLNLEGKQIVALGPGASFPGKCWPRENFLKLCTLLQQNGYEVVLVGGPGDMEPLWIVQNSENAPFNLAGELTYLETAEFLQRCVATVSNDSAIVHFSEAVGTPVISIFGPTVKEFGYGPFLEKSELIDLDLPCRPCSRNGKGKCSNPIQRQCLIEITVEQVFGMVKRIVS